MTIDVFHRWQRLSEGRLQSSRLSCPGSWNALVEQGAQPEGLLADKNYASGANREYLKAKGIGDLIQFKGSRGNPVHPLQIQMNRAIAALRYKVERGFGT